MLFGGETAESYYDEGVTAGMKGNVAQAIAHFEKALQLDPNYTAARYQLGKCQARAGRGQAAAELLTQVIRAKPSQIPPRVDLGFVLIELGRIGEAETVLKEVLSHKENHARAYLGMGMCYFSREKWLEAAAVATKAIEVGGANFAALYLLGRAQKRAGLNEEAFESFKRADLLLQKSIESAPEQPEGYYLRGVLHLAQEKIPDALEFFQSAENRAKPEAFYSSFGMHFNRCDIQGQRGVCLLRLGRRAEAEALGLVILAQCPEHTVAQGLCAGMLPG